MITGLGPSEADRVVLVRRAIKYILDNNGKNSFLYLEKK